QFDLLPNTTFYWISPTPDVGVLLRSQADVNAGIVRLQTAANTATSQKMIDDLVKMFSSLQIQVQ
ncbi:MAG: hypothetical protein HGA76_11155, partial [Candidatus Firestonebacteria bacterium]|nr:hypothetical protein [Candidatus Firestonebacteria bacterium]